MKWFKKFVYLLGVIVLVTAVVSGYFMYREHGIRKQLAHAKMCYESGDIRGAIGILEELHKKAPNSAEGKEAICFLGKCYMNLGELEKAEDCFTDLLELDKEGYGAESLFNIALIAKEKDMIDVAIKNYEQIINECKESNLVDDALLNLAIIHKDKGKLNEAQDELINIIENFPNSNLLDIAEKELGNVNINLLFSANITSGTTEYIVKEGDALFTIAQHFGTTVELIKKCNNLKSDFIKPGDKLKIITEKFSIIVDKSKNILTLKIGERALKVYRVGTGVSGSTPAGIYTITNKLINPPWHKPGSGVVPYGDPRNVLGTRWMGFDAAGYGIHGTWEPETIGKQSSAGCVRLLNEDVEELFQIVPVGTEVTVVE